MKYDKLPESFVPALTMQCKQALLEAFNRSGLKRVCLARRLNITETEVRRLLDPKHQTKIGSLERALYVLGIEISINVNTTKEHK